MPLWTGSFSLAFGCGGEICTSTYEYLFIWMMIPVRGEKRNLLAIRRHQKPHISWEAQKHWQPLFIDSTIIDRITVFEFSCTFSHAFIITVGVSYYILVLYDFNFC
jgi:hypothetical protein